jgi:hypothetical protein
MYISAFIATAATWFSKLTSLFNKSTPETAPVPTEPIDITETGTDDTISVTIEPKEDTQANS